MEEAFKADLGSEEFDFVDKLNVPAERQHKKGRNRKKKTCKCNMCGYECGKGNALLRHMWTHTGERPFMCSVSGCGMAFTVESNLKRHVIIKHSNERLFICSVSGCGAAFTVESNLKRHVIIKHSNERPFMCNVSGCGMAFTVESNLRRHIKYKHSDERSFKCDFPGCLQTFKMASNLMKHQGVHSSERPFACPSPGCSFRAKFSSHIPRHIKWVHSEAKMFACSQCDFKTARIDVLNRHMRRHSSRKDFKCSHPQCKTSFKNSFSLKRHYNDRHGERNLQCDRFGCGLHFATKAAFKDHLKLHNSSGRVFQCPLCLNHYTRLDLLQAHCVVHTNEKPFQCGHCNKYEAATRVQVRKHISSAHPNIQFPFIVHLLDDRECLRCKLTLSSVEFSIHCKDQHHVDLDTIVIN